MGQNFRPYETHRLACVFQSVEFVQVLRLAASRSPKMQTVFRTWFVLVLPSLGALAPLALLACGTTPIDAVVTSEPVPITSTGSGSDGIGGSSFSPTPGVTIPSGTCLNVSTPVDSGVYQLRVPDSDACLAVGVPVVLAATVEVVSTVVAPCSSNSDQLWEFVPDGPLYFQIRSVQAGTNLDMALGSSATGTRAVLYKPVDGDHQKFLPRSRLGGNFELSPANSLSRCLTRSDRVELALCSTVNQLQEWELIPQACL